METGFRPKSVLTPKSVRYWVKPSCVNYSIIIEDLLFEVIIFSLCFLFYSHICSDFMPTKSIIWLRDFFSPLFIAASLGLQICIWLIALSGRDYLIFFFFNILTNITILVNLDLIFLSFFSLVFAQITDRTQGKGNFIMT